MKTETTLGNPYQEYIAFITSAWNFFNKKLANSEAPEVIITIASRGRRKNTLGWFFSESWEGQDKKLYSEVNICAESLNRNLEELCETILHECSHSINFKRGVKDCINQYHNKHFKTTAESLGLIVEKMRGRGYAFTKLGPKADAAVKEFLSSAYKPAFHITRISKPAITFAKVFSIPSTEEDKDWVTEQCDKTGLSKKEMVTTLIENYKKNYE